MGAAPARVLSPSLPQAGPAPGVTRHGDLGSPKGACQDALLWGTGGAGRPFCPSDSSQGREVLVPPNESQGILQDKDIEGQGHLLGLSG